jgi:hypothetical protein
MSLCWLVYRRSGENVIGGKYAKDNSPGNEGVVGNAAIFAMAHNHGDAGDGGYDSGDERDEMTA